MLSITGLSKHFAKVKAVDGLTLEVGRGEVFGLLGANGAGKTTTMRMLATMLTPTAGTASINGFDLRKQPEKVRASTGLLFGGDTGLYERLTARENILYFAELNDVPRGLAMERAEAFAKTFDFTSHLDKHASKLSKGTRQKVALSRAIIHEPPLMMLDEPMVGLDVSARRDVEEFILYLRGKGQTILLSDHTLSVVERLCERVAILREGVLVESGTIDELCAKYGAGSLEQVFFNMPSDQKGATGNEG
ncbi:MAG: ATP-binding cassette domain-containing protein [Oscillospiraceae bacterium]|nr:ATP-binding cassette domain-containing protein [Oscillospiraceae bacterium]